jgi:hypothetical protein
MAKQRPSTASRVRFNKFHKNKELGMKKVATDKIKDRARKIITDVSEEKDKKVHELSRQIRTLEVEKEEMEEKHRNELENQRHRLLRERAELFEAKRRVEHRVMVQNERIGILESRVRELELENNGFRFSRRF